MAKREILIKTPEQIAGIREACTDASMVLDYITPFVKPGVTTEYLDDLMLRYTEDVLKDKSACLGYDPDHSIPYPKAPCISVNHQVCHGIPGPKVLKKGDILNIDVTVIKNGYYGDTSRMFCVGKCSIAANHLIAVTYDAMWKGIEMVKPGAHFGDIGYAIQKFAHAQGCSVVEEFTGHGVGVGVHEEPPVLHYGKMGAGAEMKPGMIFTIEPMINAGRKELTILSNGWTAVTKDKSLSAQWEHTVLVTDTGWEVLTVSEGSPAVPSWVKTK